MNNKKGALSLDQMPSIVILFGVVAIVVSLVGTVLAELQSTQTADTYAYNATEKGLEGTGKFGTFLPTIAIVLAIGLVVSIVMAVLYFRNK